MKCYDCKHRGDAPGDAHSTCNAINDESKLLYALFINASTMIEFENISFVRHGVENGWCIWPVNFDPVWIKHCNFFEKK